MSKLSGDFLLELARSCTLSVSFLEVIKPHLKYSFLADENYKILFKTIFDYHGANQKAPTLGIVAQSIESNRDILAMISRMRDLNVTDKKEALLEKFQEYIQHQRFLELHGKTKELYEKGQKDKAMLLLAEESQKINQFTLKAAMYSRLFSDFDKRQQKRRERDVSIIKCPTGLPAFDHHTRGGVEKGTALLAVARSGVGKSTFLRWAGYSCAFRGLNVVHFQAEGKADQVEDAYDSMWTGVDLHSIKEGSLDSASNSKIQAARNAFLSECGEVFIIAFEQFHTASIADCRQHIIEILKNNKVDVAIFDYLEKFDPGNGIRYGAGDDHQRARKLAVAEKIVNIATEFNIACFTATQSNDVTPKQYNDPDFVITRSNIANLRATVDSFAYCITLNQTADEYKNDVMRIHEEKLREYKLHIDEQTFTIAQERDWGRFVDLKRTNIEFWDNVRKKVIKNAIKSGTAGEFVGKAKIKS